MMAPLTWSLAVLMHWPTPQLLMDGCVFATIVLGFVGIIFKRNLLMKILSMDVMSTGVIALYVLVAARGGIFTPIATGQARAAYADPVPQAVILTAIVIGFSIQALMLVGVMKLARNHPTLDTRTLEQDQAP